MANNAHSPAPGGKPHYTPENTPSHHLMAMGLESKAPAVKGGGKKTPA